MKHGTGWNRQGLHCFSNMLRAGLLLAALAACSGPPQTRAPGPVETGGGPTEIAPAVTDASQDPGQPASPATRTEPSAASPVDPTAPPPGSTATPRPVTGSSPAPSHTPAASATPTEDLRPLPGNWRVWPVVPVVSPALAEVFKAGQQLGNDPHAFTVIGDCQSFPPVFMGIFSSDRYWLGEGYEYLQETIDRFSASGSFERQSYCTQNGLSVASALSPAWADPEICQAGETPIACEFRIHRPSFVFINLGTNWTQNAAASHESYLREIVDTVLAAGVIPILSTKGDNIEGDWGINRSIAQVAYDYDLPLWNYWLAIQDLPNHGLDPERPGGNYLTPDAWDRRSFTGLQVLDAVWRTVDDGER